MSLPSKGCTNQCELCSWDLHTWQFTNKMIRNFRKQEEDSALPSSKLCTWEEQGAIWLIALVAGGIADLAAPGPIASTTVLLGMWPEPGARPAEDPGLQEAGWDAGLCLYPAS